MPNHPASGDNPVILKIFFPVASNSNSTLSKVFNGVFNKYLPNNEHFLLFINKYLLCLHCY